MRLLARFILSLSLVALGAAPLDAQRLEPPATGGIAELDQILRRLGHDKRVLVIGAHPDDEDTELLTVLSRGEGAAAAYLSLTRGEGGQNLIGAELGDALGLLRTEELLAARELDGARQFFTRAYDFGYSKTLDDTWAHWPRDSVLKDVVRIVRRFRPQVVVSIFSGTPRDGHGQHQAAGWAAHEAFTAAADPARFPELASEEGLAPWQPLKLYRSARFDTAATTLTIDGGVLDPIDGRSFHQIAMRSRSLHRSQDMGQLEHIGPSEVRLALVRDRTGTGESGLFAGIDTSAASFAAGHARAVSGGSRGSGSGAGRSGGAGALDRYAALADSARRTAGPARLAEVRRLLSAMRSELLAGVDADSGAARRGGSATREQLVLLDRAMAVAGQVMVDAVALDPRVVPGEPVGVALTAWNVSADTVTAAPVLRAAWNGAAPRLEARQIAPGDTAVWAVEVPVPATARNTAPYFSREPSAPWYQIEAGTPPETIGLPFDAPPLRADFEISSASRARYTIPREVAYRFNDQAMGEVRRPLAVVPRLEVAVDPMQEVWPAGDTMPRSLRVTVVNRSRSAVEAAVRLTVPAGWPEPPVRRVALAAEDARESVTFPLRAPASLEAGRYEITASAELSGGAYAESLAEVDYPHVRVRRYTVPATVTVTAAELTLPRLGRIAYVRGAADRVPEALRSVGIALDVIDGAALARGDLSRYAAVVIGPRAYEVDSGLVRNNRRLLAFAEAGGLVIVQYQQHAFFRGGFAPYPLELAPRHDRVADETAAVAVLAPEHAVLRAPNVIGAADWNGWVQERGLYFARSWDDRYQPLLAMHDPGEQPLQGSLLVAPTGDGTWVYTGLSFFRQLPAGVPGAFRLFANLLALAGEQPDRQSP